MNGKELAGVLYKSKYTVCISGREMIVEDGIDSMRNLETAYEIETKYGYSPEEVFSARFFNTRTEQFYEFYREEVLAHLGEPEGITYQPFDCRTFTLAEKRHLPAKRITIVEGSYSCHPYFGEEVYDLRFFVDISRKAQQERILLRNGEEMLQRFIDLWIPYENKYFETYQIKEKCNRVEMNL